MMKLDAPDDVLVVLVSYLPIPGSLGEMKSKPTQYACRSLNAVGLQPDLIICRSTHPIDETRKRKLSVNCNVAPEDRIAMKLHLAKKGPPRLAQWVDLNRRIAHSSTPVAIGIIGKYFSTGDFTLTDSYLSVIEAIKHAAWFIHRKPDIVWLNSEDFEKRPGQMAGQLKELDGILIPGGFGTRGIKGKLMAIRYAREHKVPYLGLCYGMQLATVEIARHVLGWKDANTTEINPKTKHPVIHLMNEQEEKMKDRDYGGTMRLGDYPCVLKKGTLARRLYGRDTNSR